MIEDIKQNRCYCQTRRELIPLSLCDINCHRWKSCMKKLNKEYDDEVKKNA